MDGPSSVRALRWRRNRLGLDCRAAKSRIGLAAATWMPDMLVTRPPTCPMEVIRFIEHSRLRDSNCVRGRHGVWRSSGSRSNTICIRKEYPGAWPKFAAVVVSPLPIRPFRCTLQIAEWARGEKHFRESRFASFAKPRLSSRKFDGALWRSAG